MGEEDRSSKKRNKKRKRRIPEQFF